MSHLAEMLPPGEVFCAFVSTSNDGCSPPFGTKDEVEAAKIESFGDAYRLNIHQRTTMGEKVSSEVILEGVSVIGGNGLSPVIHIYFKSTPGTHLNFALARLGKTIQLLDEHSEGYNSPQANVYRCCQSTSGGGNPSEYDFALTDKKLDEMGFKGGARELLTKLGLPEALKVKVLGGLEQARAASLAP